MTARIFFVAAFAISTLAAEPRPKGIGVSTWVREDVFAGFLEGDMARFEKGVQKIKDIIAENPKAADAVCWRAGGELFLAVRAHEGGDTAKFEPGYAKALASFSECAELARPVPQYQGAIFAITGGSFAVFSDRLPAKYRKDGWTRVKANYTALKEVQKEYFDKLPIHFRGEVLAGLAQAALRLGDSDAKALLEGVQTQLPNTPYALFAKRILDKPDTAARSGVTCLTCHDAGRLEPALSRLAKPAE